MKFKYQFAVNQIADQFVAVPTGTAEFNGFVKMNDVSKAIFDALQEGVEPAEIEKRLIEQFNGTPEEATEAVSGFVSTLREKGLLE